MTCNYEKQLKRLSKVMKLLEKVSQDTLGSDWDVNIERASVETDNAMRDIDRAYNHEMGQMWAAIEREQEFP